MTQATQLQHLLADPSILVAPGIYDAMSAAIAEHAGFEALFVSGSAMAAAHLGRPDVGLLGPVEAAEIVGRIADRVSIPLLVDADQGGGNAFAVARNVRLLEKSGAAAIQIEDQLEVKPARDPRARPVIAAKEMIDKIKAAKDACHEDTVISARSDAAGTEGVEAAIERVVAYADAGADMVFVESLDRVADMKALLAAIDGRVPTLHNLLRPAEEADRARELEAMGFAAVLFPITALQAAQRGLTKALGELRKDPRAVDAPPQHDFTEAETFLRLG